MVVNARIFNCCKFQFSKTRDNNLRTGVALEYLVITTLNDNVLVITILNDNVFKVYNLQLFHAISLFILGLLSNLAPLWEHSNTLY